MTMLGMAAMASAAAISLAGPAPAHVAPTSATARAAVYGGFTSQGWAVVVDVSRDGRSVDRAGIGGELSCSAGGFASERDDYVRVPVSARGAFREVYANYMLRYSGGGYGVFSGSLTGRANRARTRMTGTWRLHDEEHDASGTVTDVCDTGLVHWEARR